MKRYFFFVIFCMFSMYSGLTNNFLLTKLHAEKITDFSKYEKNEHYKQRIIHHDFEIYKKIRIKDKEAKVFGISGGCHLGILYILTENESRLHRLDIGPVYVIMTNQDIPYLKEDEIFVVSSTGGTGQHHVFGCLIKLYQETAKIISTFPLAGHSVPAGLNCALRYEMKNYVYKKDQNKITLTFETYYDDEDSWSEEDRSAIKNILYFKSKPGIFEVSISRDFPATLNGHPPLVEEFKWIVSYFKAIKVTSMKIS